MRRVALAAVVLAGCVAGPWHPPAGVGDLAGEWRGRWLGTAGHAMAALSIAPEGAYSLTMFLDGGDRVATGTVTALPSGRVRYQGGEGNGDVRVETGSGSPMLRFVPDGGGGGGAFRRAP